MKHQKVNTSPHKVIELPPLKLGCHPMCLHPFTEWCNMVWSYKTAFMDVKLFVWYERLYGGVEDD
jgi:hypothetical protein